MNYIGYVGQAAASFYFVNLPASSPEPSYTLTYQARPTDIPKELQVIYYSLPGGVQDPYYITMPDSAWFSSAIPGTVFGATTNIYFYMWIQACRANVMVIDAPYGYGYTPNGTKGAGNNVVAYIQTSCNPFQMKHNVLQPPDITGTHGDDDLIPDATGTLGRYTNPRVGL